MLAIDLELSWQLTVRINSCRVCTMHLLIRQMSRRGAALPWNEIHAIAPLEGDIYVQSAQCAALNRNSEIATVRKLNPVGPEPINPLLDARLSGMATGGFVLSGMEEIDGCLYAQSWYCKSRD